MKEMWNQRFAGEEYAYGTSPNLFFKEKLIGLTGGKLLLPAEGEGRNAVYAASLGWQVTAVDFSEEGRRKALRLAEMSGVSINYIVDDISHMDFGEGIYDAAALIYAHLAPDDRGIVHRKITRSLKQGGFLILEAFNPLQLNNASGGPRSVEMLYTIPMMQDDFKDLTILQIEEIVVDLDQGSFHQGESAIIRVFARK
jgi:SAM-dependent methyltransferase